MPQQDLIEHGSENTPVPAPDTSILAVISRAASDPSTDVEKMERLMALYERLEAQKAKQAFDNAMGEAQEEMGPVRADANNPQTKSKYASYAALDRAIRPIYTKHGFSLSFDTGDGAPQDYVRVLCYVGHRAGYSRTYKIDMPADGKGAKGGDVMTKTHAVGSGVTYGQRYLLKAIFNIVVADDDDGNWASGEDRCITADQIETLKEVIEKTNSDAEKVCKFAKVEFLPQITQKQLPRIIEALNTQPRTKKGV